MGNIISIKNLDKSFKKLKVLKGINLDVPSGTILALLGPNGAGKTTMIRILSTLLEPDRGTVEVDGYNVATHPDAVRSRIGLTGQYAAVDEFLTGRENLEMMGRLYHLDKEYTKKRTQQLLKQFGLSDAADRRVKTYSGGMRRRIDLASSLIASPPILFLDEPTTGLDPRSRILIWDIVRELIKNGTTVILTTQYLDEADRIADKIAVIDHGKIIAYGSPDDLKKKVGKESLDIVVSDEDFASAKKILKGRSVSFNENEKRITMASINSVNDVKRILGKLDSAKIDIESFSLHKPTLDDVFLKLTGSGAQALEEESNGKK